MTTVPSRRAAPAGRDNGGTWNPQARGLGSRVRGCAMAHAWTGAALSAVLLGLGGGGLNTANNVPQAAHAGSASSLQMFEVAPWPAIPLFAALLFFQSGTEDALCMVPAGALADRWRTRRILTAAAWIGWEHALHVATVLAVIGALLWLGIEPAARGALEMRR